MSEPNPLANKLNSKLSKNREKMEMLRQKFQVGLNPTMVIIERMMLLAEFVNDQRDEGDRVPREDLYRPEMALEVLIEPILGKVDSIETADEARLRFEIEWQDHMAARLDVAHNDAIRETLTKGNGSKKGLYLP